MFGNLKNKLGDVTDLKKYAAPHVLSSLTGSRQRSSQHTPGSRTPTLSRQSQQSSITSLQNVGLTAESSPESIREENEQTSPEHIKSKLIVKDTLELERELKKLRSTLETQQDAALQRLSAKEQEWKAKVEQECIKVSSLEGKLNAAKDKELKLLEDLKKKSAEAMNTTAVGIIKEEKIKELERKLVTLQENYDQLEGFSSQESAKVKHLLLSSSSDLESVNVELKDRLTELETLKQRLHSLSNADERASCLAEEKMELETQIAKLNKQLTSVHARIETEAEEHRDTVKHLEEKLAILSQRNKQDSMEESDKNQALKQERDALEHRLEEAHEQLSNIKSSWSTKISSLEEQIQNLNSKIAEDQLDIADSDKTIKSLSERIKVLEATIRQQEEEMETQRKQYDVTIAQFEENEETLKWELNTMATQKDKEIKDLRRSLHLKEEKTNQLSESLGAKEEENLELTTQVNELQTEILSLQEQCNLLQDKNAFLQSSYSTMQENLNHERRCAESLQKDYDTVKSKLESATSEKAKLSFNLDTYLDKVQSFEGQVKSLREENRVKEENVLELEDKIREYEIMCSELSRTVQEQESDFDKKVEESYLVKELRGKLKALEDDLEEKKQMTKVQSQRLVDMKKTLQRELKRNIDTFSPGNEFGFSSRVSPRSSVTEQLKQADASNHVPNYQTDSQHNGVDSAELVNLEYLKHVILKFLTLREYEAVQLTRALSTLLHMSPEEENLLKETLEYKMSWFRTRPSLGSGQLGKPVSH